MGAMFFWVILGLGTYEGADAIDGRQEGMNVGADGGMGVEMDDAFDEGSVDSEGFVGTGDVDKDVEGRDD